MQAREAATGFASPAVVIRTPIQCKRKIHTGKNCCKGDNNSAESVSDEKSVSADPGPATQSASADPGPATQSKGASVPSSRRAIPVDTCLFSNHRSDSMER